MIMARDSVNDVTAVLEQCRSCDRGALCFGASASEREAAVKRVENLRSEATETSPICVILCSDYPIVRSALHLLIDTRESYHVAMEAAICANAFRLLPEIGADVVLLDFDLNDGSEARLAALQSLLAAAPKQPVLILTSDPEPEACHRAFQLGIRGVVLKNRPLDDLFTSIDRIHRGESWMEGAALEKLLRQSSRARKVNPDEARIAQLTKREREIIEVVGSGRSNRQIAQQLSISAATVRHHLCAIFEKLGVGTRGELIVYAYRHELADRGNLDAN
jgi:two-component system, NarL family, nitrate/nitrite response regulator NarL